MFAKVTFLDSLEAAARTRRVAKINYPFLFDLFDQLGYQGWIGCEYRPRAATADGLDWARRYGIDRPL